MGLQAPSKISKSIQQQIEHYNKTGFPPGRNMNKYDGRADCFVLLTTCYRVSDLHLISMQAYLVRNSKLSKLVGLVAACSTSHLPKHCNKAIMLP